MTPEKLRTVALKYHQELTEQGVVSKRIKTSQYFGDCSRDQLLAHALYLCTNVYIYSSETETMGKANRHLTAIQMCLSFARLYTLDELMAHNRPT